MSYNNADLIFPHLGIVIEKLNNSISIFGFRIAYYGIIIGFGMLCGLFLACFDYKRRGKNPEFITDFALYAIVLSIIGARLYYVAFEWEYYGAHPLKILNLREGGLAIYGGVIAAVLTCFGYTRYHKVSFFDIGDSGVIGLIAGQAIGRWGNFFNAEAFGGYTDSLFAMRIKESIVNPSMINAEVAAHTILDNGVSYIQVHPTFLYESVWNLCVLVVLLLSGPRKKFEGQIFYEYLVGYGLGRFFIEGLRTDSLLLWGTNIAVSQALSGVLVVVGLVMILYHLRKIRRRAGHS